LAIFLLVVVGALSIGLIRVGAWRQENPRMAAVILTFVVAFLSGSGVWLALGSRLRLAGDVQRNELLNLLAYTGVALPLAFASVFYLVELI
jgi:Na+-driven multidrug efflux pump